MLRVGVALPYLRPVPALTKWRRLKSTRSSAPLDTFPASREKPDRISSSKVEPRAPVNHLHDDSASKSLNLELRTKSNGPSSSSPDIASTSSKVDGPVDQSDHPVSINGSDNACPEKTENLLNGEPGPSASSVTGVVADPLDSQLLSYVATSTQSMKDDNPTNSEPEAFGEVPRMTTLVDQLSGMEVTLPFGSDQVNPQSLGLSGDDPLYHELAQELSGITEEDLTAPIKTPSKIAETEAELFGTSPLAGGNSTRLDPKSLPRRIPLDALVGKFSEEEYASTLVHGRGIHLPFFHPRTHDIPVANIQFRSHYPRYLDLFTHFATHAAYSLGIPISRPYYLPTKRTLWTVIRSPFAHKKSQENFERRVHKRAIKAWDADSEVVDRWCMYLQRHAMGGVGMRITKWERMPLGIGETRLAHLTDRLQKTASLDSEKIRALGEKIIIEEMGATEKTKGVVAHKD